MTTLTMYMLCITTSVAALLPATALGGDYDLVWSDEFDGTAVDESNWEFQIGTGCPDLCGWGNNEKQYYRAENATVADGFLTITAREQAFGGRSYTSARMRTQNLGDWTEGRFEMRAKMPIGQGMWPALWMLATDSPYGTWPASGEIDILEYLGHQPDRMFGTLHFGGPGHVYTSNAYTLPSGTFHEDFHEFALEWDRHQMRWYIDGVQFACTSHWWSGAEAYPAPFDQPFHLLLNLAVGGNLPGDPDPSTVFPQEYVVDYVRVYQKPAEPVCCVLFDGMDHANPYGNGWFSATGGGGGGISGNTTDLPPTDGCHASLDVGWGGPVGFVGAFGRTFPVNLTDLTTFTFWINPDAGQTYTLELNLQDDDNGDDYVPPSDEGDDDEFQYLFEVSPTGPDAIAGGGWQRISIPFSAFEDDNSYHTGGNGVFDPFPVEVGGNGQLVSVVVAVIAPAGGGAQTFRTDFWQFEGESVVEVESPATPERPLVLGAAVPNPFHPGASHASARVRFKLLDAGEVSVTVYDAAGRAVQRLLSGRRGSGSHEVTWDGRDDAGRDVASGVYFVRAQTEASQAVQRIVLRR